MVQGGTAHEIPQLTLAFRQVPTRQWMSVLRALAEEVEPDTLVVCVP